MPIKPIKRGYKVWCRADSATGYLCQFQIYEGKDSVRPSDVGLGEHVVLQLSEGVKEGTQLYFDNFFTTTSLLEKLSEKGVYAAGTLRTNRRDLPPEIKSDNKLQKGEYIWRSKGKLTAYQWRDNKNVNALSNFHNPNDVCEVSRRLSTDAKIGVTCPKVLADYNQWMGGVDRFDQKRNSYRCDRRSKKWWYRIFYYLLDAAVVNSFIQYGAENEGTFFWFRLVLGRQLTNGLSFRTNKCATAHKHRKNGRPSGRQMTRVPLEMRNLGQSHHPQRVESRRRCRWCSTNSRQVRTNFICIQCEVPLCAECFHPFHS
ncbi:piggyBac transposable element-derived protein 3-like [Ornithodoros turicata]|uniref:piggyBac transposable element-derived protein 3-like n=1 Tax=Ornithodoros turicata TaxID=34597 RepID=UPI003138D912